MKERLKKLYQSGRLSDAGIANAVGLGWITRAEADEITMPG